MTEPDRHFTLEQLAPGVWAALHRHGGWAIGNAGIVDLGGRTLVFDTCLTPAAARELRAAALALTGRAPSLVINSHHHNDHTRGNQAFPEATVIATVGTRDRLLADAPAEVAYEREHAPERLERVLELLVSGDEIERRDAGYFEPYYRGMIASHAELELRPPELALTGPAWFHGGARRAQLLPMGGGHSGDDAVLVLPDDGVVFCADLLFTDTHPYLPDGDPEAFLAAGAQLRELGATHYVPGHGPVAGVEALAAQRGYLETLTALAVRAVANGVEAEALVATPIPEPFRGWELGVPFFTANLRFLYALASNGPGD